MDVHLRRRIAFALVLTLIGVPLYLVLERDQADSSTMTPTESMAVVVAGTDPPETDAFVVPSTELPAPIFLDNTAVIVPPAVIDVVRPEPTADNTFDGRASYVRYDETANEAPCTTGLARDRARLTVTNIANGLSVTCINTFGARLGAGVDLVLDTDLYTTIADLADAPIFVRVTW